jgi:hypothetical protein
MQNEVLIDLTARFGPILKAAFQNEHSVTRFQAAHALAEAALSTTPEPGAVARREEVQQYADERLKTLRGAIEARAIKTWEQRCEDHPDHESMIVTERMIQQRMQEEINDLRAALAPAPTEQEASNG